MQRIVLRFGVLGIAASLLLSACGKSEPRTEASGPGVRRLTEAQYRNTIADLFGSQIVVAGHFDPLLRTNGLSTVGAWNAQITPSGFEQYDRMARAIAEQVVSPANRDTLVPCTPKAADRPDSACAKLFFGKVGRMLMRHPMPAAQLEATVGLADTAAKTFGDFYHGLSVGLASLLVSPSFLYIIETVEPDTAHPGAVRLNAYAKASRLSFLLWDSPPDDTLLTAAEKGDLDTDRGVQRQVDRMLASPRLEQGVRAFFSDMLALDEFEAIEKDSIIYPSFSLAVAHDAKEQALQTITNLLIAEHGDYRDLFTTRKTFISAPLGRIYQVPVPRPDGGWASYEFPADDPRSGLVTQIAFAALYSHAGRSSPTLRGRAIRESLLCQKVPDPPGNVDFSKFNDVSITNSTTRDRLAAHRADPVCAGCHKLTDPLGLALEKIDGAGQFRTTENNLPIDTSGDLDGVKYDDATGLGRALHDNPAVPTCVVSRMFSYSTGRVATTAQDKAFVNYLEERFAADGYRVPELLRRIALSGTFLSVAPPQPAPAVPAAPSPQGKSASTNVTPDKESKS